MSVATEVVYTDGVTAVTAAWLNLIQEHLAGWVNLSISVSGATVTIEAGADNDAASVYINGEQRRNESDISFTFTGAEATDTYDVYVVGDGGGDTFTMEVVSGAPAGTNTRKVAEVDFDTGSNEITALRLLEGELVAHSHDGLDGSSPFPHADLQDLTSGDPHTQYSLVDGSRAFTNPIGGIDPTADNELATKDYADSLLDLGVPVGTVMPYGGSSAPSGWLLCDGSSFSDATYPDLAAVLAGVYGSGAGTTNVPDLRGRFPMGKASSGTGSSLGASGGSLDHTHTQPSHTHSQSTHSHSMTAHSHSSPTTASGGSHSHTQSSTGSTGSHTHTGPSHTHSAGTLSVANTAGATVGAREGSQATAGLYAENDLDTVSDNSSHSHSSGSLSCSGCGTISGSTATNHFGHYHFPGNSWAHTHAAGSVSGSTASAGTGATGSGGSHSHTNPTTASGGSHTHSIGTTGTALTGTNTNSSPGNTGSSGADATGSANPPFQVVNYIIKHD
ncbi:MAG: tail fiber protein [Halobacteriales archaeon]|nr:tail fiber protein [Halobacteriales archaeon]